MSKDDIKIRHKWPSDMDPSTKIEKAKTNYHRKNNKREIEKALEEAEEDNQDLDTWL